MNYFNQVIRSFPSYHLKSHVQSLFEEGSGGKGNLREWDIPARAARDSNRVGDGVVAYERTPNMYFPLFENLSSYHLKSFYALP